MPEEMEAEATKCNSLKALRAVAERNVGFKEAAMDSIAPVKILLTDIVRRLELKERKFNVFTAATGEEMDRLWTAFLALDQEFQYGHSDKISAKDIPFDLARFISHCCKLRHYFFDTLKCGKSDCTLCLPVRLPPTEFEKLDHLPDPVPGTEGHYKLFSVVFKTKTNSWHQELLYPRIN